MGFAAPRELQMMYSHNAYHTFPIPEGKGVRGNLVYHAEQDTLRALSAVSAGWRAAGLPHLFPNLELISKAHLARLIIGIHDSSTDISHDGECLISWSPPEMTGKLENPVTDIKITGGGIIELILSAPANE
jgi:hypothetical protein